MQQSLKARAILCAASAIVASVMAVQSNAAFRSATTDQSPAQLAFPNTDPEHLRTIADDARNSLAREPLDALALWKLWAAEARYLDPSKAEAILIAAQRLSRRSLPVALSLAEIAVRRGDIRQSLIQLDHALTVHPEVSPQIYPALAKGLSDPSLMTAFLPFARRPWMPALLGHAAQMPGNAEVLAQFIEDAQLHEFDLPKDLPHQLLEKLTGSGAMGEAARLARALGGEVAEDPLQFGFSAFGTRASLRPFSWAQGQSAGVAAEFDEAHTLHISIPPGQLAIALSRLTALPPGTYRLRAQIINSANDAPMPRWHVQCRADGNVQSTKSTVLEVVPGADFMIANGCKWQSWTIAVRGLERQEELTMTINDLRLSRR